MTPADERMARMRITRNAKRLAKAEETYRAEIEVQRTAMREVHKAGVSLSTIAEWAGTSKQNVHKMIR